MSVSRQTGVFSLSDLSSNKREPEAEGRRTRDAGPRKFARIPTHVVGVADERRIYPRAALSLPLQLRRVAGQTGLNGHPLVTRDISSSGVYFLAPYRIEPGTPVEIEIGLVDRPSGRGNVRMHTLAYIVRAEPESKNGWHGLAATFEDISFHRDEPALAGFL